LAEKPGDVIRSRMHPVSNGKPAKTLFHPLLVKPDRTLLLVRTLTGRKHQIRCHLAALGFPILGDKTYSLEGRYYLKRLEAGLDAADLEALGAPHHLLHAFHLEIRTADGAGIEGTDFDLPEPFFTGFPEFRDGIASLPDGGDFQRMG
jgi:23S rRNA pseudouridine1911/1915/1917 synthase